MCAGGLGTTRAASWSRGRAAPKPPSPLATPPPPTVPQTQLLIGLPPSCVCGRIHGRLHFWNATCSYLRNVVGVGNTTVITTPPNTHTNRATNRTIPVGHARTWGRVGGRSRVALSPSFPPLSPHARAHAPLITEAWRLCPSGGTAVAFPRSRGAPAQPFPSLSTCSHTDPVWMLRRCTFVGNSISGSK